MAQALTTQASRPEPTISVLDLSTGQTINVTLEDEGMETVGALVPKIEAKIRLVTGNADRSVIKLASGTTVIWLQCYGTGQDSSSKTLDYYLLDGEAWIVKTEILPRVVDSFQLNIKDLSGKTAVLNATKADTIAAFKRKVQDSVGFPVDHQRLVFAGKQLEDPLTLADYDIQDGSIIHVVMRLRGGGITPGTVFVDMSNPAGPTKREWSSSAPEWRMASPGLCLEGICENRRCRAYKRLVIMNQRFVSFDLIEDSHSCKCPTCSNPVVPTTCAFNNCRWKWVGKKIDAQTRRPIVVRSDDWKVADNAYHRFDEDTSGSVNWLRLKITTKPIDHEADESVCSLCLLPQSRDDILYCGQHKFHLDCIENWKNNFTSTCPLCQAQSNMTHFQRKEAGV